MAGQQSAVCTLQMSAHTFAGRAADAAGQDGIEFACAAVEQISAVAAEDEGADC